MKNFKPIAAKLRKVRVSPKFAAILACMVGESWTTPSLSSLTSTSDGFLLGARAGDIGYNDFLGTVDDLERNVRGVAEVAGLTSRQTAALLAQVPRWDSSLMRAVRG